MEAFLTNVTAERGQQVKDELKALRLRLHQITHDMESYINAINDAIDLKRSSSINVSREVAWLNAHIENEISQLGLHNIQQAASEYEVAKQAFHILENGSIVKERR